MARERMMIRAITPYTFARTLVAGLLLMQLTACGVDDIGLDGSGSSNNSSNGVAASQPAGNTAQVLSGSVGDGPITGATITVYNAAGEVLATTVSDSNAFYSSSLVASADDYPLLLDVSGGIDLVTRAEPDFRMLSIAMSADDRQVNINPFTTMVVKSAQSMAGGLTPANIDLAKIAVINELGFGLDAVAVPDVVTTVITDFNVADIVKASEAMGEMIRRVRDAVAAAGGAMSGDDVIGYLAADMVDGIVDGYGAAGAYPELATLARHVSAQVLVETMSNQLEVSGVVATAAMDSAITSIHPAVDESGLTDGVPVTARMLEQALSLLDDARFVASSASLDELAGAVAGISEDMSTDDIALALPPGAADGLDSVVGQAAGDLVVSPQPVIAAIDPQPEPAPEPDPSPTGSVTLDWTAPVMRADNAALSLSELGGFRIYYGTSDGNYTSKVDVTDGSAQTGTVKNLPPGTYYFVVTAYDTSGRESGYSNRVAKVAR